MKKKNNLKSMNKPETKANPIVKRVNFGDFTTTDDDDLTLAYSTVGEIHADKDHAVIDTFSTDDEEPDLASMVMGDYADDAVDSIINDYSGLVDIEPGT